MLRTAIRYLITGALALVVMVAPVLIVFLLFQRWFVRSIADSAIQG
jgi:ABC-type glycerol-3-phosphate transport system permease component